MAETKEKIYRIKFEGTAEQTSNLVALKNAIEGVKKEQEALNLKKGQTTEQNEKLIIQLKDLNKQYQAQQAEVQKTAKATQEGSNTLEKMRARLALMHKEYDKTPIGTKAFKEQAVEMKKLQDQINGAEEATGRFYGSVGNYKNKIVDAFGAMGISVAEISNAFNLAKGAILGMEAATTKSAMAMKVLKIALASTGIGLIVVALGSLIAYLTGTQAGIDKVNKVLEPMKLIFQRIVEIAEDFGSGLMKIFSGDFKEGFAELGKTASGMGEQFKDAAEKGTRLAQITVEIEQARIRQAENEDRISKAMEEQRVISRDVSLSDAERKKGAEAFVELSKQDLKLKTDIAKLEYEQASIKLEQDADIRENQLELAQKKEALNKLEAEAIREQGRVLQALGGIRDREATARLKAYDDELKKIKEFEDSRLKIIDDANRQAAENKKAIEAENPEEYQFTKEVDPLMDPIVTSVIAQQTAIREQEQMTADLEATLKNQKIQNLQDASNALIQFVGRTSTIGKGLFILQKAAAAVEIVQNLQKEKAAYWANPTWSLLPDGGAAIKSAFSTMATVRAGISLASIAAQTFQAVKFAKGGIVGGNTHENGGTVYRGSDGQVFEAERGELITVVNRHDTERLRMLSAANSMHGRAFFASGGVMTPTNDFSDRKMRAIIRETVASITEIPVVVSERDISKSQRRVSVIENAGNL